MSLFLANPLTFAILGWQWFWSTIAMLDGRIALLVGVIAWFVMERAMTAIFDPLLKALAVFGCIVLVVIGGTVYGGVQAGKSRPAMNFERLYKLPQAG
jgi:uncharacterized protein (DUF2062 family)